jgi:hypothetical protein
MLFIGLPVKSIGSVCGSFSAAWTPSGPSRSMMRSRITPQHMLPLSRKASPPNMRFWVTPRRLPISASMRSANGSS